MAEYIQNDTGVCPYCKRRIHTTYNKVLNLTYRKDLNNQIKLETLNTSTCLFCDETFRFEAEIFAFDLQNKFAIIVNKEGSQPYYSHLRKDIYYLAFGKKFHLRYVNTCLEMIEKVRLFHLSLNDRQIELAKQIYFADIMDNLPEHHRFLFTDLKGEHLTFTLYDDHDKIVQTKSLEMKKLEEIHINTENKNLPYAEFKHIGNKWAKEYINGGIVNE